MLISFKNSVMSKRDPSVVLHGTAESQEPALRSELFSADQMARYGEKLAFSHKLTENKTAYFLLNRLTENEQVISRNCEIISGGEKNSIAPAGEWLLDNFYLIEEQVRLVRQLLPKNFGKGLPQLTEPHHCPRIYDIATEAIIHSDGLWDATSLSRFITAYQQVTPLNMGELWALPGMLRLALIENLRQVSVEVAAAHQERNLAERWVVRMLNSSDSSNDELIIVIAEMARSQPFYTSAFIAELVRRLQGHGSLMSLPLSWIEHKVSTTGHTTADLIANFNKQLARNQVSVSNIIIGLRKLNEVDWADFAEAMSLVEQLLHQDPAQIYAHMHFDTRDHYRHSIEMLSRYGNNSEIDVARQALSLAQAAADDGRMRHVGYYLIDKGRDALEQALHIRAPMLTYSRSQFHRVSLLSWLGSLILLVTAFSADILYHTYHHGLGWTLWLLAPPIVLVVSQFVMNLLSESTTRARQPQPLPRMDFSGGIPEQESTLIVIPCLLGSRQGIDRLISRLEVCYLSNAQTHLYFALLTDYHDRLSGGPVDDDALLLYATLEIQRLNRHYAAQDMPLFCLLHRDSELNAAQGVWMGYERKRGKLNALNCWLRGQKNSFSQVVGCSQNTLRHVRYVITLDSDTVLPREMAHRLIAAMAHPLNKPVYSAALHRVIDGYAILQPRLAEEIPVHGQGRYAALCSSEPGHDPYSSIASDIYQDLFGEGSYVGKGIYDVDMFTRATENACPENLVLSHDLLEGCYARSGLLSDAVLYEQFPNNYLLDVARRSRWTRGDWQLLNWLRWQVRQADGSRRTNPLSGLSRWKLWDNLRRSLVAPALLVMIFSAVLVVPNPGYWWGFLALMLLLPCSVAMGMDLLTKNRRISVWRHIKSVMHGTYRRLLRIALMLMTLPHESLWSLQAIVVTLWRLNISHRYLHEWASTDGGKLAEQCRLRHFYRVMWINPLAGLLLAGLPLWLTLTPQLLLMLAAVAWIAAPALLWWLSRPVVVKQVVLPAQQQRYLRDAARDTWSFFTTFVDAEDNWLPPDNYQDFPLPVTAHRTSPTNIGLSLLANLTAWDFGYITQAEVLSRTSATLDTLDKLEHFRGHLYNWYDTRTLEAMKPRYISSVDSGNLAGHLLTLSAGMSKWKTQPVMMLSPVLTSLSDMLERLAASWGNTQSDSLRQLRQALARAIPKATPAMRLELNHMSLLATAIRHESAGVSALTTQWAEQLQQQLSACSEEYEQLFGWMTTPQENGEVPSLLWLACQDEATAEKGNADKAQAVAIARQRLHILDELSQRLNDHARMDFKFLFNHATQLLSVGYNCDSSKMDTSYYDLLSSEIRLTNYVTITTNQLPLKSWFTLGRLYTAINHHAYLMSWSGSMFEYLMPQLVMPFWPGTLLEKMCQSAVKLQMAWGKEQDLPWGVSESAYAAYDNNYSYKYHAFGVPSLGLKRGLSEDKVIAPYATMLALLVFPRAACDNLLRLEKSGARGQYGFYEALDYTPSRLARGESCITVRCYMAHHQGMSLLALSNCLLDKPMVARFAASPVFQSGRLLLQERIPTSVEFYSPYRKFEPQNEVLNAAPAGIREFHETDGALPEVQLLSNSHYHVVVTQSGGGFSSWKNIALTRWRSDTTRDNRGTFCYLSDPLTGELWSNTCQPTGNEGSQYHAILTDAGVEFDRQQGSVSVHTHMVVSPEDDVELRRMTLTHRGRHARSIDITTYVEVVLAPPASERAHPAFNNLFIQTELVPEQEGIICYRRPRTADETSPCFFHIMAIHGAVNRETSFETDRAIFIGRGRTSAAPHALQLGSKLTNSAGAVLDPIMAMRNRIELKPGIPVVIDILYGVAATREQSVAVMEKYRDHNIADRVLEMAWSHSQVMLRQINATEERTNLFNRLASVILYPGHELRADTAVLMRNRKGQSGLWGYSLSGDLPMVVLTMTNSESMAMVTTLIQAHDYWRLKGLVVDLVILNNDMGGYQQQLYTQITSAIDAESKSGQLDKPGGIFLCKGEQLAADDLTLLMSVACVYLDDRRGTLLEQLNKRMQLPHFQPPLLVTSPALMVPEDPVLPYAVNGWQCFNGLGGFSADGREYGILLSEGQNTPAPWCNVMANDLIGSVISESGQAYSWVENAHEYRLTPWENDAVTDEGGETLYIRDEESGHIWSPTPLPARGKGDYLTRHGFGYSVFQHQEAGIETELTVLVAEQEAVKLLMLRVSNHSRRTRKISVTACVDWVLGSDRTASALHIITAPASVNNGCGILASNHYNSNGSERTAFFALSGVHCSFSGDRREFLGRNGSPATPVALKMRRLSDKTGAGYDPCAALQSATTLIYGDQRTFIGVLGAAENASTAEALIATFLDETRVCQELDNVHQYWHRILDKVQVETPDPTVDLLVNGWLSYQTLACRIMARSGYYQSGGAWGFRDQLQDTMALAYTVPERLRQQLVLCASRQFPEGDVQHWWHPPLGNGVRTQCSDDFLWLPLALCHYVSVTDDVSVLEDSACYLEGRPLMPEEESSYTQPARSDLRETLWQHGVRAIKHGLRLGEHGLPLMGSGDWNDGMNTVGLAGKGESVWLGFFLYTVLQRYAALAQRFGDDAVQHLCQDEAEKLKQNLHDHGWDGAWYLRGYFDSGETLGSHLNVECRIDAIAQSWSVLSGAGDPQRSQSAMQALDDNLVDQPNGLIKLLTPPFDGHGPNPGYIRGYLPGVRENGGQYTHGAIWAIMAFARMGNKQHAWDLFRLINPINHSRTYDAVQRYKVEPYVMSADIYANPPHNGRGGWSWYTGSAGWTWRLLVESLIGLTRKGNTLQLEPFLPEGWPQLILRYQHGGSEYKIRVIRGKKDEHSIHLDGVLLPDGIIPLSDDGLAHQVTALTP